MVRAVLEGAERNAIGRGLGRRRKITGQSLRCEHIEQGSDTSEKLKRVQAFWGSQGFVMPTLFDSNSEMFKAYASPGLPSMVLISPSGKIFRCHEGLFPEMKETLKRELRDSLAEAK